MSVPSGSTWRRINANTYEVIRKKAGKIVLTSTNVLSKDGKTMTVTLKGHVPTAAQKAAAERIAKNKAPEYKVVNRLVVKG